MDLNRFKQDDWSEIRERLDAGEGGFNRSSFVAWLSMPDTENKLVERFGDGWSLGDALTLATGGPKVVRRAGKKKQRGEVEDVPEIGQVPVDMRVGIENIESRVSVKVDLYEADFEDMTANDRASVKDLAYTEVALDELHRLRVIELAQQYPNSDSLKRYGETIKILSEQTRALQKMLDIDRATRLKSKKKDAVDDVMEVIEAAGRWVEEESIEIKIGSTLIGFLVTDFPELEHRIMVKLPKEGWQTFEYFPTEKAKRAIEPDWVGEEELRYGVQAFAKDDEFNA